MTSTSPTSIAIGRTPSDRLEQDSAQSVQLFGVSKSYDGVCVLSDATFGIAPGTVHALVGGNGSGKSTLVKILSGAVKADHGGSIRVGEVWAEAHKWSRELSHRAHVNVVHQDPCVFDNATVAENMSIGPGFVTGMAGRIRWRATQARVRNVLERFDVRASPTTYVWEMRPAERMKLAIARALQDQEEYEGGLLILDEPTAALPRHEVSRVVLWIREYATQGRAIIFVSHHLEEVLSIADEVTVLRDGAHMSTSSRSELNEARLIELITGRAANSSWKISTRDSTSKSRPPALEAEGLAGGAVHDASLSVGVGEIVGVAGMLGSGRTTLLELIFGARERAAGDVRVGGRRMSARTTTDAAQAGISYVPDNRALSGFYGMSVGANLSATVVKSFAHFGVIRHRRERTTGREMIARYDIRPASLDHNLENLSGGNQQKVIIARAIRSAPKVMLLDEPTQGVDVGARVEIHRYLREVAVEGTGVLVVSSDLDELASLCDRIVIMRDGVTRGELSGENIDPDTVFSAVYGERWVRDV